MENIEKDPLKDLLAIASRDVILATKIAEKFPISLIDYEAIIKEQVFCDSSRTDISLMLIERLNPKVFSLSKLLKLRSAIQYTNREFASKIIARIPDGKLDVEVIFKALESGNEEEQFLAEKLSERLPKSVLSLRKLFIASKRGCAMVSLVSKRLIVKYYSEEISFETLCDYVDTSDKFLKTESIRALLHNRMNKLNYIDFIRFQLVEDEKLKLWVKNLALATSASKLEYVKLFELYDKFTGKGEGEVRETIEILIQKINVKEFSVTKLFDLMSLNNAVAILIREILIKLGRTRPFYNDDEPVPDSYLKFEEILLFVNSDYCSVRATSRELLVALFPTDERLTFELLDSFYNEANMEIKQKIAEIMLVRFRDKLDIIKLIPFLGLQMPSIANEAKTQIYKFDFNLVDVFEVIKLSFFYKSCYDLTPIRSFVENYLLDLPKEVILKDEKKLRWYAENGGDKKISEVIIKLLTNCQTDYMAKVEEFFSRHKIKSA